jgi:hypothetical protein
MFKIQTLAAVMRHDHADAAAQQKADHAALRAHVRAMHSFWGKQQRDALTQHHAALSDGQLAASAQHARALAQLQKEMRDDHAAAAARTGGLKRALLEQHGENT